MSETMATLLKDGDFKQFLLDAMERDAAKPDAKPRRAPMADQAAQLQRVVAAMQERRTFAPGDLVSIRNDAGSFKHELRPVTAMVYVRALDDTNPQDWLIIKRWMKRTGHQGRLDCMVGHVCDDGHCLIQMAMNTQDLLPWTPDA